MNGSRDATLRVWDVETRECLYVLVVHVAAVLCVHYGGRLSLVSGAFDYTVKVWDVYTRFRDTPIGSTHYRYIAK